MSTIPVQRPVTVISEDKSRRLVERNQGWESFIAPLGSLKIAVVSFALSIALILIGTLAQVNRDIWEVLEVYFKVWFTWVEVPIFFPQSWVPPTWDAVTKVRLFVAATVGFACVSAALIWLNESVVRFARQIASAVLGVSIGLSLSSLIYGGFWFPGGATIGLVMAINLAAAHLTRYRIQAKGNFFSAGLGVTALGLILTWLVIASGHNTDGFQGEPPFSWQTLWLWTKIGLSAISLAFVAYAVLGKAKSRFARPISGGIGLLLAPIALWLWAKGDAAYLGDSAMRVLWQLNQATFAGLVLLAGCVMLFRQRAGVVVLHAGIGLLMFGQWFVSQYDVEQQMRISEGQTVNFASDIRSVELAVTRRDSPEFSGQDDVVVVPLTINGYPTRFLNAGTIEDEQLPFAIDILDYQRSSSVRMQRGESTDKTVATTGRNAGFEIVEAKPASGAMGSSVDIASGYFRFTDPKSGEPIATYLLSQEMLMMRDNQVRTFDLDTVKAGDVEYEVQLRFAREYKDYAVHLIDVRKDDYLGTNIPRNYSSEVRLVDEKRNVDQELTIWMNNPRRYAGETFYQSQWGQGPDGVEYTVFQIVRNHGWMIPYVACMICVVGMAYHFLFVLLRFLDRQFRTSEVPSDNELSLARQRWTSTLLDWRQWVIPVVVIASFLVLMMRLGTPPGLDATAKGELDIHSFGDLPLVYQGRVKPFDTLARNSLRTIADAETFKGILPPKELAEAWPQVEEELKERYPAIASEDLSRYQSGDTNGLVKLIQDKSEGADYYAVMNDVESRLFKRQPAIRWLLDVITGSDQLRRHKVFRIYHPQVLDLLDLKRRKYYRYSLEEIMANIDAFQEQVAQADATRREDAAALSLYQKKILELDRKIRMVMLLHRAFSPPEFPALPTPQEFRDDQQAAMAKLGQFRQAMMQQQEAFTQMQPPLAVPPVEQDGPWQAYAAAWPMQVLAVKFLGQELQPSFQSLNEIMLSYLDDDAQKFNTTVAQYHRLLQKDPPKELQTKPTATTQFVNENFGTFYRFESYFNHLSPFQVCSFLYVLAFAILSLGWLKYRTTLNRIAFWLLLCTFVVHTLALVARIYISGRPPVTNLYSSAVFIGWGVVLLALVIELIFRTGLASLTAAASGFVTLLIAHRLAADGDTFEVLQAVLDTQFWLATHVVCITFGYATTFLAGGLGILYIARGLATPSLTKQTGSELSRMIYGTLCFAIFFSFFGTVLGGLWADDSWGRFWGWDPKENGALIIVLWNALILHARWDRLIRDRGLAVLAVVGNIVTAWSWFGVNELGVGLHSYGFTEGRLRTLGFVVLGHLALVAAGGLPLSMWWSYRRNAELKGDGEGGAAA
jgi:ABC-type transport system involved in cytochrome c biogenesis permease subunit